MHSTHRLQTGLIRLVPAAALLAALFVPLVAASADEDCPPGGCPIAPPQSREVNPSPARADGSPVEVAEAVELPPVEINVHVLAPAFVDPAPVGGSFETISVPVRYQNEGDVSCGVQALGMAMDALPGAAPTSASLLGLLEDNGMMYEFGTGVEELAFAAQSFGYTGSFGFHGATMDQLRGQLATGSPVVVDLGANGESEPGHFVTVTGVSSDGEWVAYNDPTLGKQVMSASGFERLWGLQGNSGVVVAAEPPPAAGVDTGALSLWVAFAAGVMALVSTTPLAKFRQGIGGMLDAGGGGSYTPARSAPKSSPPAKEKEKEKDKPPKTSKARFDDEVVGVTTPAKGASSAVTTPTEARAAQVNAASKVVATPTELRAAQDPPDREERRSIVYTPTQATQGTPREEREDPDPTPKVVQTPGPTLTPSPRDAVDDSGKVIPTATPGPDTQSIAAVVTQTPEMPEGYVAPDLALPATGDVEDLLKGTKLAYGGYRVAQASAVHFNELPSGYLSVTVSDSVAVGEKIALRTGVGYAGTRYSSAGLLDTTTDSILKKANGKASVGFVIGIPLAVNLYDYGLGDHKDIGIKSNEFAASALVDIGKAAIVGLASAGVVALGIMGLAALGVGAVATAPAWAIAGAVVLAGIGIGAVIDSVRLADGREADDALKEEVSDGLGAWGDLLDDVGDSLPASSVSTSTWRPR